MASITERQLRALSKKHLLLMILDLETELAREKEKNADMLRAFRTGIAQQTNYMGYIPWETTKTIL